MRRKLPLYVERSIQQLQAVRMDLSDGFGRTLLGHRSVSCRAGCAACCRHPLNISVLEAIPIYGALVARGLWTTSIRDKLRETSNLTAGLSFEVWLLSKIACPLLDENSRCMAYEDRPFQCRVTYATGDPHFCDPQRLGSETTIVPRNEAMNEFKRSSTLILHKHGLMHLTMPIGRAVLMAEQVCSGQLTLESVDRTYVSEHLADDA